MAKINEVQITKELMAKAMQCDTPEELVKLAKAEGFTLTKEEAEAYLCEMEDVDLDSAQMKKVAGGSCYDVGSTGCGDKGANPRP